MISAGGVSIKRVKTVYTIQTEQNVSFKIGHVSDLHGAPYEDILSMLAGVDMIAVTGDLVDQADLHYDWKYKQRALNGYAFLSEAAKTAPTYYSLGNHEGCPTKDFVKHVKATGAVLLDNRMVSDDRLQIAGLSTENPDLRMLRRFARLDGYKVLLCHNPEYYPQYMCGLGIDLILSGHAHGGQIQVFGRGLYAPGQGWFPKLTHGVYDGRLVVNRGATNTVRVPRIGNRCEVGVVEVVPMCAAHGCVV